MSAADALSAVHEPNAQVDAAAGLVPRRTIDAVDIVKDYHVEGGGVRRVLDGISFSVTMGERLALLGRNGAGKSTLIKILSGMQRPTAGHVRRGLQMSWPLAFSGGFEGELTGSDNIRFIARLYNAPMRETFEYVADFTELGSQLNLQMKYYSSGMRMRLAFALSLAIQFECLLIDEVIVVGDRRFQQKCHDEIFQNRKNCAMIVAIHSIDFVKEYCQKALILKDGRGRVFDDIGLAEAIYTTL
ncbi:MAG TPA: ABC transporter ATP-binding protein [Roseiarcus sp.]|nr:ABC transporter ATP-binding protein [Roseiarcus sp.]